VPDKLDKLDKRTAAFTFHKIREQAEQSNTAAWHAFLDFYSPLYLHLLALYAPVIESAPGVWEKTLVMLFQNDFERFRATSRQSEREFLADVRALLFDNIVLEAPGEIAHTPEETPGISLKKLGELVADLPLLHQEILFFKLAGYTDTTLELVMRVAPRVAQTSFERLEPDYAATRTLDHDRCLWPAAWIDVLRQARAAKTEKCPELHQFLRIQDGQVSWYDKEPIEAHVSSCLHCLAAWTALREVGYWRRAAPQVPPALLEQFSRVLPIENAPEKSLLRRFFG
jgi:hypothetical protein